MKKYVRNCPKCNVEISYSTKYTKVNAEKNNNVCRSCASSGENNGMYGMVGEKNPFFGKTHTKETKEKQSKLKIGKTHTKETKEILSNLSKGKNNGMYGKSFYDVWINKYGKIEADKKFKKYKKNQSLLNRGENNNMYGKPSPKGSGNGWSGWYKNWFFRSLNELTFMINVIERFNFKWENGESNEWRVKYLDYDGNQRNYFPDFILNDKYMIECKPKKLWNSDSIVRKRKSAIIFCKTKGLKYKMIDVGKLSFDEIQKLYENGEIKFTDRYELKFKKWKQKNLIL